jgi:hypothetical protein
MPSQTIAKALTKVEKILNEDIINYFSLLTHFFSFNLHGKIR